MKEILKKIAESENITEDEVRYEIDEAIKTAMQSDDPQTRKIWAEIAPDGEMTSQEEIISKLAMMIAKRKFYI